jgi:uncharacterized protein YbbK (DUF523 family)
VRHGTIRDDGDDEEKELLVVEGAAAAPVGALLENLVAAAPGSRVACVPERRQPQPRSNQRPPLELSHDRPRLGISACLLGDEVRYDGGHKRNAFLVDVLGARVEWVRVCPEVEVGMGTPRETLHLVRQSGGIRMVTTRTGLDYTDAMEAWASRRVDALAGERLSGYILKKDSPSCGLERVALFDPEGHPVGEGRGLFAQELVTKFPDLPVEDEGRLAHPHIRDEFIERVFAYWRSLLR